MSLKVERWKGYKMLRKKGEAGNYEGDYYIGLDCGTSSVGWAVSDPEYNLLRAHGKDLLGSRLFEEANTAEKRRLARGNRRRTRRSAQRLKLLELLFQKEMSQIDPEFYLRLQRSFLLEEDKNLTRNSTNTLFNDPDYSDKDFHKAYPTIWHLRQVIIKDSNFEQHFDLRLYYLAIHHIIKHRGHFLREGKLKGLGDFGPIFQEFSEVASKFGFTIETSQQQTMISIITNTEIGIRDRRKQLKEHIFAHYDDTDDNIAKRENELAGLLAGSKVTLLKVFDDEVDSGAFEYSFNDGNFEDKLIDIETSVGSERLELIEAAKAIFDYGLLSELLGEKTFISDAMVSNYQLHQEQLAQVKKLLKPFPQDYKKFFQTERIEKGGVCYNAYIGKAYSEDKQGRRSSVRTSQEDINKEIKRLLEKHNLETPLLELAEKGRLLPKQRGQAKGTIPQQLHHNELEIIVEHLQHDYPDFAAKTAGESEAYNTKALKILRLHDFRIPYYCGPLPKRKYDDNGQEVPGGKSEFSWGDEEIKALVRPWNFYELVDTDQRADNFIRRMTNKCTYLPTEKVLPKASLLYQKYMVLNELNNLSVNSHRVDAKWKQQVFERGFVNGELKGNITWKAFTRYLRDNGFLDEGEELSGGSEEKFLPKLSTHQDFVNILGADYEQKYSQDKLEKAIEQITILNNEPKKLAEKIQSTLNCTPEQAKKLAHRPYRDWARFSTAFLTQIKAMVEGQELNIITALWETNYNLMELLSQDFQFYKAIEFFNHHNDTRSGQKVTYSMVADLYCSPAVKRTIWQALEIVNELVTIAQKAPKKIFIEATREEDNKQKGYYTLSRHKQLKQWYQAMKKSDDVERLLAELNSKESRELQNKKLYLYFTQMGRCAYSGEPISLDALMTKAYDIDHIYPRSKTKDDSITQNLVLVKAEYNREKTNVYPIEEKWRNKMRAVWGQWYTAKLITKEKYSRLIRATKLTPEELSSFVARQIVETSQAVKGMRDLLALAYPDTKIVMVKAGQVSNIRKYFAQGYIDKETGEVKVPGRPEFIKVRELNDLHHARDAYLNIVVGNVMSMTFGDNPYQWFKTNRDTDYSLNSHNIWRSRPSRKGFIKGWKFQESIDIISDTLKRNGILWTRKTKIASGAVSKLQIVGKAKKTSGILPIKKGLDPKKYGGYNSITGAYFCLVEISTKNGPRHQLVQVPIAYVNNPTDYLRQEYPDAIILIDRIPMDSLLKINGNLMHLRGRTGNNIICAPAIQLHLPYQLNDRLKKVTNVAKKLRVDSNYKVDQEKDGVSTASSELLFDELLDKVLLFKDAPGLKPLVKKLQSSKDNFLKLPIEGQCGALVNVLTVFSCDSSTTSLASFVPAATSVGRCVLSNDITDCEAFLIHQSPTGIFERVINLNKVKAQT